jgi:hypothetical protein
MPSDRFLRLRTGNRQLNAALHRIALTQARCHPDARALLDRRKAGGDGGLEALRILKRRLSDVVYRAMITDQAATKSAPITHAALQRSKRHSLPAEEHFPYDHHAAHQDRVE